jgi:deoxyribodipyrimidine photolyase
MKNYFRNGLMATPSDFINANMIELKQTGFMSNRGRQMWRVIL